MYIFYFMPRLAQFPITSFFIIYLEISFQNQQISSFISAPKPFKPFDHFSTHIFSLILTGLPWQPDWLLWLLVAENDAAKKQAAQDAKVIDELLREKTILNKASTTS